MKIRKKNFFFTGPSLFFMAGCVSAFSVLRFGRGAVLAGFTDPVKNGPVWVQRKMMLLQQMGLDINQVIAVQVDQSAAADAFAVEADLFSAVAAFFHEFKAGGITGGEGVFVQEPFTDKLFQLAVNGGLADGFSPGLEIVADVRGSEVFAGNGFEIGDQALPLPGFVFRF